MKKLKRFSIITLIFFISCYNRIEYYQGYIYDKNYNPLVNVKVTLESTNQTSITDNKGFFKIKKNSNILGDLIVFKKKKIIDTIKTVWRQHGEKIKYSFVENQNDTLFIK